MSETLNFGPQWLRALSGGGGGGGGTTTSSVTSPPPSPGITQFKLAEFRYGREEMLALFKKSNQPPSGLEEFLSICRKDSALPMALTSLSEEEQHALSQCVNSTLVLRLTGRGTGGTGARGRGGTTRGRGRGRGEFMRSSYDEEGGGGGGGGFSRNFNRTQSWDESRDSRFRNFEESGPPSPRKHFDRSISENWRSRSERGSTRENGEEDGGWRQAPSRTSRSTRDDDNWRSGGGGPRTSWRHPRERNASFNEYDEEQERDRGERPERRYSSRNRRDSFEDAAEDLPEWAMDDAFEGDAMISSFDSSGAFFSMKKEEKDGNKKENKSEDDSKSDTKTTDSNKEQNALKVIHKKDKETKTANSAKVDKNSSKTSISKIDSTKDSKSETTEEVSRKTPGELLLAEITSKKPLTKRIEEEQHQTLESVEKGLLAITESEPPDCKQAEEIKDEKVKEEQVEEEDPLARIEKEAAEDIVKMTEEDDDDKLLRTLTGKLHYQQQQQQQAASKVAAATADIPRMWYYKDPQGAVQGPFSAGEMADWFGAGYFTMTLLVKRSFDDVFLPLGELIKQWGRVPFIQGPEPMPTKVPASPQVKMPSRKELTPEQQLVLQQQLLQQQMMQLMAHQQQQILMRSFQIQQQFAQKGQILTPQQQQFLLQQLLSKMRQHQYVLQKQQQAQQHPGQQPPPQLQRQISGAGRDRALTPEELAKGMKKGDEDGPIISVWGSSPGEEVKKRREDYEIGVWQPEGGACQVGRPGFGNDNWEVGVWDPSVGDPNFALKKQMMNAAEGWDIGVWDPSKPQEKILTEEAFNERIRKLYFETQAAERMQALARQQGDIKLKEELKRKEEELKKQQEELQRREDEIRRQEEQRIEEMRRREDEEKRRIEQRQQQIRQEELLRQKEEANRRVAEEERKRKEQEMLRQQEKDMQQNEMKKNEMMNQELLQRQQEQVLRRLQQQQQRQQQQQQQQSDPVKLPSTALWGQVTTSVPTTSNNSSSQTSPSLSQIQNLQAQQEERDRHEKQRRMQAQLQEQQQQNRAGGWAAKVSSNVNGKGSTKSLREIQEEQSRQQKHKTDPSPSKSQPSLPLTSAAVWRGNTQNTLSWGTGSSDNSNNVWGSSSNSSNSGGFWDECARESPVIQKPKASDSHFPTLRATAPNPNVAQQQQQHTQSNSKSRTAKEEENVKRLFQSNIVSDEFTAWCEMSLRGMSASVDIPTFITFLQDVDSPYELHDYIKMYLGESRETAEFARQFVERRQKMRQMENPWMVQGKSSQITSYGDWESDSMRKSVGGKKKKRFQTLDPSILGFSVNPADRINMGEIQTVDD